MDDAQVFHGLVGQLLLRVPVLFRAQKAVGKVVMDVLREGDLHVVEHRHGLEQADVLKRAGNTGLYDLIGLLAVELLPAEVECPLRRHIHTGEQVKDCGLACTVRADEPHELALMDLHIKIRHCLQAAEGDAEVLRFEHNGSGIGHASAPPFSALAFFFPARRPSNSSRSSENSYVPRMPLGRKMMTTSSTSA